MNWTVDQISLAFRIAEFILMGGVACYVYLANKDKATNARLDAKDKVTNERVDVVEKRVDDKLDSHGERITRLEGGPTHGRIDEAHTRITDVMQSVSELAGEVKGVKTVLNLIHDHLLNGRGK